ncbi:MAG: hypothetical protein KBT09_01850 [Bacteroidales bacterium]|nr:hypothetical protein [Candidatus Sodaliphilus fimicaballi]
MNNDKSVDIADINTIVSVILKNATDSTFVQQSDVNDDGSVDIADINSVIAFILTPPRAAISWVDDDFNAFDWSKDGALRPVYQELHDFCLEHNVRLDFARGSFSTPYNAHVIQAHLDLCLQWQSEGFHYLYHPNHSMGWYDYDVEHPHDASKIEESAMDCFLGFEYYGFDAPKILVWPGDSHKFEDNYPVVRRLYDCAISATYKETNHRAENDRHCLKRLSLECLKMGYLTKTEFKQYLKEAVDRGDWIILGTHFVSITESDVPDETSYNTANAYEIIQYADSLCHIRPTGDVWAERKHMWGL